jgi:hypothetical protein
MKNQALENSVKEIIKTDNVKIEKGKIGGASIEVYILKPNYVDLGSFIYTSVEARDKDFNALLKVVKSAKQVENV